MNVELRCEGTFLRAALGCVRQNQADVILFDLMELFVYIMSPVVVLHNTDTKLRLEAAVLFSYGSSL